ncbi:MAG: hypothetical protein M3619_00695 [Myxococcota bacterium]|nr:hypothetical protein [Myxococcota bacterium]
MNAFTRQSASILTADLDTVSVKRLAWAFGCAKKNSDEEIALVEKIQRDLSSRP